MVEYILRTGKNQTFCFGNDFWKSAGNSRNRLTGIFGQALHGKFNNTGNENGFS